jgi:glycosyltransferase involved in cell wall biosynthesis
MSVLLCVCNDERFLSQALDSLLAQTWTDFEIVAVDDASTDGSAGILERYAQLDTRLRVIRQPQRQGLAASLNLALFLAQGPVVTRMDSDDISLPERFARQMAFLKENPAVSIVGCQFEKIDAEDRSLGLQTNLPLYDGAIRAFLLEGNNPFCHGGVMMRRSVILEMLGGYRQVFSAAQDFDLWLRVPPSVLMRNLPEVLYRHRRHAGAVSSRRFLLQRQMKRMALALAAERQQSIAGMDSLWRQPTSDAQIDWVERFLKSDLRANRGEYATLLYRTGKQRARQRAWSEASQCFGASLRLNPWRLKIYPALLGSLMRQFLPKR